MTRAANPEAVIDWTPPRLILSSFRKPGKICRELTRLEAFAPDAVSPFFEGQHLDLGTSTVDEDKPVSAGWIRLPVMGIVTGMTGHHATIG